MINYNIQQRKFTSRTFGILELVDRLVARLFSPIRFSELAPQSRRKKGNSRKTLLLMKILSFHPDN